MFVKDGKTLDKYSRDRSPYSIRPKVVAIPKGEGEVIDAVRYARSKQYVITGRGAGSNLSGSAIGTGMIVDLSKMTNIGKLDGKKIRVQPGVIFDDLNRSMKKHGLFLPYGPSSGAFCTIGGNTATKASGLHSVKYGSIDSSVRSVRFIDVRSRVIDTSRGLPEDLRDNIMKLREKLLSDGKAMAVLKKREGLKTSSGYNLRAFYKYKRPEDIVTHLLVGSAGSLGLFTEIELELTQLPKKKTVCLAYFRHLADAGKCVMEIRKMKPSALEIMDSFALSILRSEPKYGIPSQADTALVIEFDGPFSEQKLTRVVKKYSFQYHIERDKKGQAKLWSVRKDLLTAVERREKHAISFVEDIGVPVEYLANFMLDLQKIFLKNKMKFVIFGHAGEGNLHLRPVVERKDWKRKIKKVANECYAAAFSYGGTVTAEHGMGRNKSPYIKKEWGSRVYSYFLEVKKIFDPYNRLNPDVLASRDITKNMRY